MEVKNQIKYAEIVKEKKSKKQSPVKSVEEKTIEVNRHSLNINPKENQFSNHLIEIELENLKKTKEIIIKPKQKIIKEMKTLKKNLKTAVSCIWIFRWPD